ncbi:MAG: Lrp/AsnC family transcriptional regulator [Candidatus Hydrothermarchaeales archaeon]
MDEIDMKILEVLKKDSRTSYKDIARETHISDVAVHKRIKKLSNVIRAFTILVDQKTMGEDTTALLTIKCEVGKALEIAQRLSEVEDVREVYTTIGEYDIIAKIKTENTETLKSVIEKELSQIKGLNEVRTSIVFECLKEDVNLIF